MSETRKPLLSGRKLIDFILIAACIALLVTMLMQMTTLKRIETDTDGLRSKGPVPAKVSTAPTSVEQVGK